MFTLLIVLRTNGADALVLVGELIELFENINGMLIVVGVIELALGVLCENLVSIVSLLF